MSTHIPVGKEGRSRPISRVLSWTAIPLGPGLLQGSSHLPASSAGRVIARLFGVAPGGGCRVSPSLTTRFSARRSETRLCGPIPRLRCPELASIGCVAAPFSIARLCCLAAANSVHLVRTGVTRHRTLRSPDFPLLTAPNDRRTLVSFPCAAAVWPASPPYITAGSVIGSRQLIAGLQF